MSDKRYQGELESVDQMKHISAADKAGRFNYHHPRESDEDHRWRCLKRNMRHDERLDSASGLRLLNAAKKLPSAREHYQDVDELESEFNERFGEASSDNPR